MKAEKMVGSGYTSSLGRLLPLQPQCGDTEMLDRVTTTLHWRHQDVSQGNHHPPQETRRCFLQEPPSFSPSLAPGARATHLGSGLAALLWLMQPERRNKPGQIERPVASSLVMEQPGGSESKQGACRSPEQDESSAREHLLTCCSSHILAGCRPGSHPWLQPHQKPNVWVRYQHRGRTTTGEMGRAHTPTFPFTRFWGSSSTPRDPVCRQEVPSAGLPQVTQ